MLRYRVMVLIAILGLLSALLVPAASAEGLATNRRPVRLLSSTATGVTFELDVPWEDLSIEPVMVGDVAYVRVSMPGWAATAQSGAPALPFLAQEIGAPFGMNATVHVVPGKAHTLALPAPVLPVATQVVERNPLIASDGAADLPVPSYVVKADAAVYAGQSAYPSALAEFASDGVLRQQRVLGIAAYPVQYHPDTQELTVYESLRVILTFTGPPPTAGQEPAAEFAVYEDLLQRELLNHESARAWRRAVTPPTSSKESGAEAAESGAVTSGAGEAGIEALPWAPPVPGWRVKVRQEGFYKLSYSELITAGLPVDSLDPQTFQLYNLGSEVAIYEEGDGDKKFESGEYLVFYGQAVASKYTWDNVYWLTYGQASGLRMIVRDGTPPVSGGTPPPDPYYSAHRHLEQNLVYDSTTPGDEALERFLWDYSYPPDIPSSFYTFSLVAPYTKDYTARLRIAMLGALDFPVPLDHHTQVYLNGHLLEDAWWDGLVWRVTDVQFDQKWLTRGSNTVELRCPNDTGAGVDAVYIDWIELDFANTFLAEGNELLFSYDAVGTWTFPVEGFSAGVPVAVYDVTNPAAAGRIEGAVVERSGSTYTAKFQDMVAATTRYWATVDAITAYRTVQAIEQDTASNLQSTANGADHIIITHKDFAAAMEPLRVWRATQMRAMLVDVQNVYDEFGYGIVGAAPIRDFLAYAYANWSRPAPSYVVLVGDAHYDPKNYMGYGKVSYLPPYLAPVDPWLGETAADNRYVTFSGTDNVPDMMLGRLAVSTSAQATAFVNKILAYEQSPVLGDWQQQVLAVADNADGAGNFAQMSDGLLADHLPSTYQAEKVYYGVAPYTTVAAARTAILAGINAGTLIVNYTGHAAVTAWASESLLTTADVAGLTNGGKMPVMLAMTCYDGYYIYPYPYASYDSLAEVVTRADGRGAVASWSPTGLGVASGHEDLNIGFYDAVFQDADAHITLGEATMAGKLNLWQTGMNLDLLDTYLLFGDPATVIALPSPTAVELLSFMATATRKGIALNWETATELDNLGFNLYRATSVDGTRVKLNAVLIQSLVPPGSTLGAVYTYTDATAKRGATYYYWLEDVDKYGRTELHGPVSAKLGK